MSRVITAIAIVIALSASSLPAAAQEVEVHHGFIFYAGSYTLDEETYGLYEDGHAFAELLDEVPPALAAFHSFETFHTMGNVFTGLSLAAFVVGGVMYMPGVEDEISSASTVALSSFGAGGGLLLLGVVFEFVAWSRISAAAELYNEEMEIDDGPMLRRPDAVPLPSLALLPDGGARLALRWTF